jgi:hypothetical protein
MQLSRSLSTDPSETETKKIADFLSRAADRQHSKKLALFASQVSANVVEGTDAESESY